MKEGKLNSVFIHVVSCSICKSSCFESQRELLCQITITVRTDTIYTSTEESLASHWFCLVFGHCSKTKICVTELPRHIVVAIWADVPW